MHGYNVPYSLLTVPLKSTNVGSIINVQLAFVRLTRLMLATVLMEDLFLWVPIISIASCIFLAADSLRYLFILQILRVKRGRFGGLRGPTNLRLTSLSPSFSLSPSLFIPIGASVLWVRAEGLVTRGEKGEGKEKEREGRR